MSNTVKIKYKGLSSLLDSEFSADITTPESDDQFSSLATAQVSDLPVLVSWKAEKLRDLWNSFKISDKGREFYLTSLNNFSAIESKERVWSRKKENPRYVKYSNSLISVDYTSFETEQEAKDFIIYQLSTIKISSFLTGVKESDILSLRLQDIIPYKHFNSYFLGDRLVCLPFGGVEINYASSNEILSYISNEANKGKQLSTVLKELAPNVSIPVLLSGKYTINSKEFTTYQKAIWLFASLIICAATNKPGSHTYEPFWCFRSVKKIPMTYSEYESVAWELIRQPNSGVDASQVQSIDTPDGTIVLGKPNQASYLNLLTGQMPYGLKFRIHYKDGRSDYFAADLPSRYMSKVDYKMPFDKLFYIPYWVTSQYSLEDIKNHNSHPDLGVITNESTESETDKFKISTLGSSSSRAQYSRWYVLNEDVNYFVFEYNHAPICQYHPDFTAVHFNVNRSFLNAVGSTVQEGNPIEFSFQLLKINQSDELAHLNWFRKEVRKLASNYVNEVENQAPDAESVSLPSLTNLCLKKQKNQFNLLYKLKLKFEGYLSLNYSLEEFFIFMGVDFDAFKKWVLSTGNINLIDIIDGSLLDLRFLTIEDWKLLISAPNFGKIFSDLALDLSELKFGVWNWLSSFFEELLEDLSNIKAGFQINSKDFDWKSAISTIFQRQDIFGTKINSFFNWLSDEKFFDGIDFIMKSSLIRVFKPFIPRFKDDIFLSLKVHFDELSNLLSATFKQDLEFQYELESMINDSQIPTDRLSFSFLKKSKDNDKDNIIKAVDSILYKLVNGFNFNINISSILNNLGLLMLKVVSQAAIAMFNAVAIASNMFKIFELSFFPVSVGKPLFLDGYVNGEQKSNCVFMQFPGNKYIKSENLIALFPVYENDYGGSLGCVYHYNDDQAQELLSRYTKIDDQVGAMNQVNYLINGDSKQYFYYPSGVEIVITQATILAQAGVAAAAASIQSPGLISRAVAAGIAAAAVEAVNQVDFSIYMANAIRNPHFSIISEATPTEYTTSSSFYFCYPTLPSARVSSSAKQFIELGKEIVAVAGGFVSAAILGGVVNAISRIGSNLKERSAFRKEMLGQKEIKLPYGSVETDKLSMAQIRKLAKAKANGIKLNPTIFPILGGLSAAGLSSATKMADSLAKLMLKGGSKTLGLAGSIAGSAIGSLIPNLGNSGSDSSKDIEELRNLMEIINRKLGF